MRVSCSVMAWAVVVAVAASALAQTNPQTTDTIEGVTRPGHLVESASPNTGMVIPEWDDDASVDERRQSEQETTLQTDSDDELNDHSDDKLDHESIENQDIEPAGAGEISTESEVENAANADASAATVIPRPSVVEQPATGDGEVVPRNAIDAPWYRHPAIALFVVVAAILGVAMVFRKYVPSSRMIPMQAVRVVGRAPISAKHSIALLHVGQRLLVVGMTADRVSTLSEITDPQEVSLLLGASGGANRSADVFGAQLADQIEQFGMGEADDSDGAGDLEDRSLLNETKGQLQGLLRKLRSLRAA